MFQRLPDTQRMIKMVGFISVQEQWFLTFFRAKLKAWLDLVKEIQLILTKLCVKRP